MFIHKFDKIKTANAQIRRLILYYIDTCLDYHGFTIHYCILKYNNRYSIAIRKYTFMMHL